MLKDKIVKVRWNKFYVEAHNHVAMGKVLEETPNYLKLHCRTFHFPKIYSGQRKGATDGKPGIRIIPWCQIALIHELPADTDWDVKSIFDENSGLVLSNKQRTVIAAIREDGN